MKSIFQLIDRDFRNKKSMHRETYTLLISQILNDTELLLYLLQKEMNSIGYFEIQASDPVKALAFYQEVFGWHFTRQEFIPIEYYRIETPGINGGLLKRPVQTPPLQFGTNAFTCSMEVEDFDKTAELILSNGGIVAMAKFAIPGQCWQGYFIDTDNNTFGIFQPDENAK